MSACYGTYLNVKFKGKNREEALKGINEYALKELHKGRIEFQHKNPPWDTVEEALEEILAKDQDYNITKDTPENIEVQSFFNASYGWEDILVETFKTLKKNCWCMAGDIYPDSGAHHYRKTPKKEVRLRWTREQG